MAQSKLHQVLAVLPDKKGRASRILTDAHRLNDGAVSGQIRTYQPKDEDGHKFPPESKSVGVRVPDLVSDMLGVVSDYYDEYMTLECGNQGSKADIMVEEKIIAKDVPVTVLLMLKKQLADLKTFVSGLPTLPLDREWTFDENKNLWTSRPEETTKTQKTIKPVVLYEATDKHPAQVEKVNVDEPVGTWTTIHLSGAVPVKVKREALNRVAKLQEAVNDAHAKANMAEVEKKKFGADFLNYIFEPVKGC